MEQKGTLYVVSTPIGNLEDLSRRACRILGEVSLILAEDTRVTRKLLTHLGLGTPLQTFDAHREAEATEAVVARLLRGDSVALVSDAGTPLLSDPGFPLVAAAGRSGIAVRSVPGPSAITAALSISGLPVDRFSFLGFFPRKAAAAEQLLASAPAATLVFFESPHRIEVTLDFLARLYPARPIALAREITKVHEEVLRGTASEVRELTEGRSWKGEIVLLLGKEEQRREPQPVDLGAAYEKAVRRGLSRTEALREVGKATGLARREIYRRLFGGSALRP